MRSSRFGQISNPCVARRPGTKGFHKMEILAVDETAPILQQGVRLQGRPSWVRGFQFLRDGGTSQLWLFPFSQSCFAHLRSVNLSRYLMLPAARQRKRRARYVTYH